MQPTVEVFITGTSRNLRSLCERLHTLVFASIEQACQQRGMQFRYYILSDRNGINLVHKAGPLFCFIGDVDESEVAYRANSGSPEKRDVTRLERLLRTYGAVAEHVYLYVAGNGDSRVGTDPDSATEFDSLTEVVDHLIRCIPGGNCLIRRDLQTVNDVSRQMNVDLNRLLESICARAGQLPFSGALSRVHEDVALMYGQSYIPVPDLFEQLDAWYRQPSRPLVVVGQSEVGKSGLLASWSETQLQRNTRIVIRHFVEADPQGSDHSAILRHILSELRDRGLISTTIPSTLGGMEETLRIWIAGAYDANVVIIIDGVDQLPERSQELRWLPADIPAAVRLIISVTPGSRVFDVACGRQWQQVNVPPPTEEIQHAIMMRLSGTVREESQTVQAVAAIDSGEIVDAALTLSLGGFVEHMLKAERTEQTDKLLRLIWGARYGLSRSELCDLMALQEDELVPLLHRIRQFILISNNRVIPIHRVVRVVIERCLVSTQDEARAIHLQLGHYFSSKPLDARRAEEEPWQWWRSKSYDALRECIQNPLMFSAMIAAGCDHELLTYWRLLGGNQEMANAYRKAVNRWHAELRSMRDEAPQAVVLLEHLGSFMSACGLYPSAVEMLQQARDLRRRYLLHDSIGFARVTAMQGEALRRAGRFDRAIELLSEAYVMLSDLPEADVAVWAQVANDLGLCLYESGDRTRNAMGITRALEYLRGALQLKKTLFGPHHLFTAETLSDMALVYQGQGDYRAAIMLYEEVIRIQREATREVDREDKHDPRDDHPAIATSLNNLAGARHALGQSATAMTLYFQALDIRERILGPEHPHTLLTKTNIISLYLQRGDRACAREMCEGIRAAVVATFDDDHPHCLAINSIVAQLLQALGQIDDARDLLIETAGACMRTLGIEHQTTATCLHNLAGLYRRLGEFEKAREYYEKALVAWRAIYGQEHPQVATALCLLARVLMSLHRKEAAAETLAEALAILERTLGLSDEMALHTVYKLAAVLVELGRCREACTHLRRYIGHNSDRVDEATVEVRALYAKLGCNGECGNDVIS